MRCITYRLLAPFVDVNPYKITKVNEMTKAEKDAKEKMREIARKTLQIMLKSFTG